MLDLSAAFDTVDHTILIQRLSLTFGINDTALQWFSSYLSDRFQSVHFAGNTSPSTPVLCGVPQGSVLGPLLFLLYTADIGSIASKHHIKSHSFADDTQLYLSGNPKDAQFLRSSIVACISDITEWCAANKLKLNPNKTEFLWSATARRQSQLDTTPIDLSDGNIRPSKAVRDLGVTIDSQLSFAQHVNSIACKCYAELRRIKSFRRSLPNDAARTLMNSLVVSKIDLLQLPTSGITGLSHRQASICHECSSQDCMRSQKIRPHHKPHARLPTLAARSATSDVQAMSTHIQISPRLCTRLSDGTLQSGCTNGTEAPLTISCSRRSDHPENNNIVWRSRLCTCRTSSMEQSTTIHQSSKDTACV